MMPTAPSSFRTVPHTGVIFVMSEAQKQGFTYQNPDWINLGQGAPEAGVIPNGPARLTSIPIDEINAEYSPVAGMTELREAVAHLYNTRYRQGRGSRYTAANVAISSGGRSGLTRIAAALGNIHLGHLLPDYTAYAELLDLFRNFIPIPIVLNEAGEFRMDADRLRSEIIGKGLGALLFSNPANPTGQTIHGSELEKWAGLARSFGCVLIADEFYSHYLYDDAATGRLSSSLAEHVDDVNKDPVLIVDGLTKNWRYPGLRLSWTVGPAGVIERVISAGSFLDGGAAHPIQRAAIDLVRPEQADAEAMAIQKLFGTKRTMLMSALNQLNLTLTTRPSGGFYCFPSLANLPDHLNDGMKFFKAALAKKLIVVPGEFFDVDPGHRRSHIPSRLKPYVRISFGPDQKDLAEGLHRISQLIGKPLNI